MRIGLTGGIAAGKSTVSARMREDGASVIDYDILAREIVRPGSPALADIAREFGSHVLLPNGALDRAWLAEHVFSADADPQALERLNAIEHPRIFERALAVEQDIVKQWQGVGQDLRFLVIVHDIPLLAEVHDDIPFPFDHVVTVEAPRNVRIARMMTTRGMSLRQARDRIANQTTDADRLALSDTVIDANQPLEAMNAQVDQVVQQWRYEATAGE